MSCNKNFIRKVEKSEKNLTQCTSNSQGKLQSWIKDCRQIYGIK